MNLILCGLPLSGKTTIGRALAASIGGTFLDTDEQIEKAYVAATGDALSCRQIFMTEGEASFREWEKRQIASLTEVEDSIIAVGGGALLDEANALLLRAAGLLIYLRSPWTTLWSRGGQRRDLPAYLDPQEPERSFYAMAARRAPLYEKSAHLTLDVDCAQNTIQALRRLWQVIHSEPFLRSPPGENLMEKQSVPLLTDALPV